MQVESRLPPGLYHGHPPQSHVNGVHSDSKPNYSSSSIGHSRGDDMHPYQQQHYAGGHPAQQQRQYSSNQLPPMYPGVSMSPMPGQPSQGVPGPSNVPHNVMYNQSSQMQPGQNVQQQDQQRQQPLSQTGNDGTYKFELRVEQQPQRARMCGFGDKDRRPITPPPCIKLVITDMAGNPVSTSSLDGNFFVLQVDLWDDNATREVNIVRSSSTSPAVSISTATTTSYPPVPEQQRASEYQPVGYTQDGQPLYHVPRGYPPGTAVMQYPHGQYYPSPFAAPAGPAQYAQVPATSQQVNMYTRNLIGSLTVNASVLKDNDGLESFWFVLQDLSVRTEGWFRLKMNFINVGTAGGELNKGKAAVLAYVFSDKFQVYSAKKFPGVIESTPLSKCFAAQGIKIPIRKDLKMEEVDADDD